jgi:hypothetical protein
VAVADDLGDHVAKVEEAGPGPAAFLCGIGEEAAEGGGFKEAESILSEPFVEFLDKGRTFLRGKAEGHAVGVDHHSAGFMLVGVVGIKLFVGEGVYHMWLWPTEDNIEGVHTSGECAEDVFTNVGI